MSTMGSLAIKPAELEAMKTLALVGASSGETKISCTSLADRLNTSSQTASRRLQSLAAAGLIEREVIADGQWVQLTDDGERILRAEFEEYRRIFERPDVVTLSGSVTGGMGEGRHYISLSGYMEQFRDRLGYEPFPGTLNVALNPEAVRRRSALTAVSSIPIDGWSDEERTYGPAVCYPATVEVDGDGYNGAHVIEPERTHHDEDQLELIAPEKLRDVLGIDDGDPIDIHVEGD